MVLICWRKHIASLIEYSHWLVFLFSFDLFDFMLQVMQNDVFIYLFLLQLWMLSSQDLRLLLLFLGLSFVLGMLQRSIGCQTTYWGLLSAFRFEDFLVLMTYRFTCITLYLRFACSFVFSRLFSMALLILHIVCVYCQFSLSNRDHRL